MLEVAGLIAGHGETLVLQGIDITVGEGEIVAVLGANGAGKSTLNNALSGLVPPRAGSIRYAGEDIACLASHEIVARGLIHVPEGRRVFPNLTVRENLELGGYRRGRERREANLQKVVAVFPRLAERFGQSAGTLSGGEQQMLAIGRGLMAEPRLLILDEPSLGLSPLLVEEMFALIRRIRGEGLPVLLVEQNVAQSLEIADRAYVIEQGRVVLSGPTATLLDDPRLKRAYLGM
ncbi:MAG: ABC transporter ATP-binding protein [Alphaproteobacteria bacterium]|nr:ABC transporter ATP-binding protein [Alphaproteobacteria bacterium]